MPKLKPNKPVRRLAKATRAPRSYNPGNPPDLDHHESVLIGLTDPFSSEAAAAKYPDQGSGRTLTFQQRFSFAVSTDTSGAAVLAFNPKVNFPILGAASVASNIATWPATWSSAGDATTNLVNVHGATYRPTSFGFRASNTMSATDSAGYLVIAKGGSPILSSTTTISAGTMTSFDSHPLVHGGEWHSVGNPRSATAYEMRNVSGYNVNTYPADDTWETVYLAVFGSKISSPVLFIELYVNYEYSAKEDSSIAQLATSQPVLDIQMQTAINAVQSSHPASHKGAQSVVKNFIRKEGKKALLKHVLPWVARKATMALA